MCAVFFCFFLWRRCPDPPSDVVVGVAASDGAVGRAIDGVVACAIATATATIPATATTAAAAATAACCAVCVLQVVYYAVTPWQHRRGMWKAVFQVLLQLLLLQPLQLWQSCEFTGVLTWLPPPLPPLLHLAYQHVPLPNVAGDDCALWCHQLRVCAGR